MLISPTVLKRDGKGRVKTLMVNRSPLVVLGEDAELDLLTTTLFQWFFGLWMLLSPLVLVSFFTMDPLLPQTIILVFSALGAILALASCLKPLLRCQLVLDTERQELFLRYRRFFLFTSLMPLGGAEELAGTTWAGELPQAPFTFWWRYVSLVVTKAGRRFRARRSDRDPGPAENDAQRLAHELGTVCYPSKPESLLSLSRQGFRLEFRHRYVPAGRLDGCVLIFWGVMIVPSGFMLVYGLVQIWSRVFGA